MVKIRLQRPLQISRKCFAICNIVCGIVAQYALRVKMESGWRLPEFALKPTACKRKKSGGSALFGRKSDYSAGLQTMVKGPQAGKVISQISEMFA
jgi:hypothetical protein